MSVKSHWNSAKNRLTAIVSLLCFSLLGAGVHADIPTDTVIRPNTQLLYAVNASPSMPVGFAWQLHVASDGTVNLGSHGNIKVAGMTFTEAKLAIDQKIGVVESGDKQGARPKVGERLQRFRRVGEQTNVDSAVHVVPTNAPVSRKEESPAPSAAIVDVVQTHASMSRKEESAAPSTAALAYQSVSEKTIEPAVKPPSPLPPPVHTSKVMPSEARVVRLSKGRTAPLTTTPARLAPLSQGMPELTQVAAVERQTGQPMGAAGVLLNKGRTATSVLPEVLPDGYAAPHECATVSLPPYIIHPPDILLIEATRSLRDQPVRGQHLVRPDGTVGLGIYGSAYVAGMTLDQAKAIIAHEIGQRVQDFDPRDLSVDVLAYNSKVYYVITDGGGYGEQVYRLPVTGYETVLDAIAQINGLPPVASKKHIWVARPCAAAPCGQMVMPVDWKAITRDGMGETNYQLFPGDRVYVRADKLISIDSHIAKALSPVERLLGVTLLGSTTYNSISGRGFGFGN